MSLDDNYAPVKQSGNGVTNVFTGTWNVFNSAYIVVALEDKVTGVQTLQVLGTNFTLTFDDSGFSVDFSINAGGPPSSSVYVVISRSVAIDQTVPYKTSQGFQGSEEESSFDKLTAICQDLNDALGRTLSYQVGSSGPANLPVPVANYYLRVSSDGLSLQWQPVGDISALLPSQTGNAGKFLKTDGTNPLWDLPLPAQSAGTKGKVLSSDGANANWVVPSQRINYFLNGSFQVWQRGTSFQMTGSNTTGYCADRWFMSSTNAAGPHLVSRQSDTSFNTPYLLRVQRLNGQTDTGQQRIGYVFETADSYALNNKDVIISLYAKCGANYSAASSIMSLLFRGGTGTDQSATSMQFNGWTGTTNLASQNLTLTTSWQRFTIAIPAATMASYSQYGLQLYSTPVGTAGAADYWDIKDVQIEEATTVSPFIVEPFGATLERCKRYFQKTFIYSLAPQQNSASLAGALSGNANGTTIGNAVCLNWRLPVVMRASPTVTTYNPSAANANLRNVTASTDLAAVAADIGDNSIIIVNTASATDNNFYRIHASADAEL